MVNGFVLTYDCSSVAAGSGQIALVIVHCAKMFFMSHNNELLMYDCCLSSTSSQTYIGLSQIKYVFVGQR